MDIIVDLGFVKLIDKKYYSYTNTIQVDYLVSSNYSLVFSSIGIIFYFKETSRDSNIDDTNTKKKSSASIDCSHYRVANTTLPSIKIENSTPAVTKASKEDFSSAKQKRASFHSGTNRAFLDPIRSSTEFRWNSMSDKNVPHKSSIDDRTATEKDTSAGAIVQSKENVTNKRGASEENLIEFRCDLVSEKNVTPKMAANSKLIRVSEKNARVKATIESRDASVDDKTTTIQRTNEVDRFNLIKKTPSTSTVTEDKDSSTIDKATFSRNSSEVRCSSVNERNPPSRKTMESQKIDGKSRRTCSAPPQRRFESTSGNNRVQINIVIDSSGKNKNQGEQDMECKDNAIEKIDTTLTKVYFIFFLKYTAFPKRHAVVLSTKRDIIAIKERQNGGDKN